MKERYIIGYDIKDDKNRRKITKHLEDYGVRWQYSVFECRLSESEKVKLVKILDRITDPKTDSVFFIPISNQTFNRITFLGQLNSIIKTPIQPSFF
ncbi:MAG: CRISPR-associated endonuclease Cas2 [Candidatus Cloacimonadota bacterium]|nr:MAG: CRISPR-associated endonuclease Cas2 [Candidatus Cloacimonadota bacterium]PIE78636.1 MAG: CRISPR-associated endonuclease Cas2 [Candidatus Delongbacteria bacterium]